MYTIYFQEVDHPQASYLHLEVDTFYTGIEGAQRVWDMLKRGGFHMVSARP